jgi:hypothetical protein
LRERQNDVVANTGGNWWDSDDRPHERFGLEGLPRSSEEIVSLDGARYFMRNTTDSVGLFILWAIVVAIAAAAIWGGSLLLGALDVIVLSLALWWSAVRVRRVKDARRMRRRVAAEKEREKHS